MMLARGWLLSYSFTTTALSKDIIEKGEKTKSNSLRNLSPIIRYKLTSASAKKIAIPHAILIFGGNGRTRSINSPTPSVAITEIEFLDIGYVMRVHDYFLRLTLLCSDWIILSIDICSIFFLSLFLSFCV